MQKNVEQCRQKWVEDLIQKWNKTAKLGDCSGTILINWLLRKKKTTYCFASAVLDSYYYTLYACVSTIERSTTFKYVRIIRKKTNENEVQKRT